jgi:ketosteroid isomerase-like protein
MMIPKDTAAAVVTAYITALSNRQWDQLPGYFTPNATWWVSGNPVRDIGSGPNTAAGHLPMLPSIADKFDNYKFDILNLVGRPGDVMIEGMATGTGPADLLYVNNITMAFKFDEENKITSLREYPVHSEIVWLLDYFKEHGMM